MFSAKLPLFDVCERGRTEESAMDKLKQEFEKNHGEWITKYVVTEVFG